MSATLGLVSLVRIDVRGVVNGGGEEADHADHAEEASVRFRLPRGSGLRTGEIFGVALTEVLCREGDEGKRGKASLGRGCGVGAKGSCGRSTALRPVAFDPSSASRSASRSVSVANAWRASVSCCG